MAKKSKKCVFGPRIIFAGLASLILLGFIFLGIVIFYPNAELIVVVAPSDANIRLDGKKIENGAQKVRAGKHRIDVSLDGLESKTQELSIAKGETKSVSLYLTGYNRDFSYYLSHEKDVELLGLIGDEAALDFVKKYHQAKTITELLPIRIVDDLGESSSRLELGEDCERSYCLKILSSDNASKEKMLEKIKSLGYNPEDYDIKYETEDE